ncbi:hypothetical protein K2173_025590 [Erythroxylum novogranatense]|uniref:Annexin n=1 Tax=Erythroxylum novogranatense TaxID=1862640 RepID=A0AAV8TAA2_9ROSI|nr:hypothetical protein K2173_025590 [Erythroxylum novogranatense]
MPACNSHTFFGLQVFVCFLIISQMPSQTPRKLEVCASPMATRICNICKEIHDSWGMLNLSQLALSLAGLSKLERKQIKETYKVMYGEDMADLHQRIQVLGNQRNDVLDAQKLCTALSVWMLDSHERDATFAREAIEQADTNYKALVEIFVGRKSSHIMLMKQAYQVRFRRQLDQDIINLEPPHPYQKILVALSTSHKAHQVDVSQHIAKCDAMRLYEAGESGSRAIDESVVLEILSKRSIPLMKLTFCSYKHIYGHDYTKSLKNGNSKDFEATLRTVIKCMCSPTSYYAKKLFQALQVSIQAADAGELSRMIMSRAEVDMNEIQGVLQKKYGTELRDAICERIPSGDYRDFLVALATKAITTH